jgi:hypothetical protein
MSLTRLISIGCTTAGLAVLMSACGTTNVAVNTANTRNANAIVVNASPSATPRPSNANISREEYDRDRATYERDKGSSTIGQGINDSWIWFKTRTALATTDNLRDSTINVDVVNDVITLKGTVATAAQKTEAETVAKGIEGQKGVKNELKVSSTDSATNQMVNGNTNSNRRP